MLKRILDGKEEKFVKGKELEALLEICTIHPMERDFRVLIPEFYGDYCILREAYWVLEKGSVKESCGIVYKSEKEQCSESVIRELLREYGREIEGIETFMGMSMFKTRSEKY
ncbi:MAG: hypothetical protein DRP11_00260 [Candidatus Aenigmatarchaeota archaeon]|nr:MAG: hypothetical protein DRP11_00260 [Candidatus Aenigmarchaeota archaeon]